MPKLNDFLLTISNLNPDITVCCETWIGDDILDDYLNIPNFDLIRCDRPRGGVCVWVRNNLEVTQVNVHVPDGIDAIWFTSAKSKTIYAALYLPPRLSSNDDVFNYIVNTADILARQYPNFALTIFGDLNQIKIENILVDLGLQNMVRSPTRGDNILDYILVSHGTANYYSVADILPPLSCNIDYNGVSSDHNIVFMRPKISKQNDEIKYHTLYDLRSSSIQPALNYLNNTNFSQLYQSEDVNEMCDILYHHIHKAISMIPRREVQIRSTDKKWMTPLLKSWINSRWDAWRSKNLPLYMHYRDKVRRGIVLAKKRWVQKNDKGIKGIWRLIDDIRGKSAGNTLSKLVMESSQEDVARKISDQLMSNYNWNQINQVILPEINDDDQVNIISEMDTYQLLSKLNTNKAAGSDNLHPKIILLFADCIVKPLTAIYNSSLRQQTFPTKWKLSTIIPIPKTTPPCIEKMRPISLLPILGKSLEKLQINFHYEEIVNCYGPNQHAYRRKGSCTTALIKMQHTVTSMMDESDTTAVRLILFDMKAAFDRIRHDLIIRRLIHCEVSPNFINWIESYLDERQMHVRVMNSLSETKILPSSVPQGSVIGPYIFAAFMGSLELQGIYNNDKNYVLILYADDILLIERITTRDLQTHNSAINIINTWCNKNDLTLNHNKTAQMFIRKSTFTYIADTYDNIVIHSTVRYLGIVFNEKFNFKDHFLKICSKASQRLYILRCIKHLVNKNELFNIFSSIILSIILYACPIFVKLDHCSRTIINRLLKRCHSLICNYDCTTDCKYFVNLESMIFKYATKTLLNIEKDRDHPLHNILPHRLPRTNHFFVRHIRTTFATNSFVPIMTQYINNSI